MDRFSNSTIYETFKNFNNRLKKPTEGDNTTALRFLQNFNENSLGTST